MARDLPFPLRVGARIRRRRLAAGLSQEALARCLPGVVATSISRWERGVQWPSPANIEALAGAFDCTEEELLCRDV